MQLNWKARWTIQLEYQWYWKTPSKEMECKYVSWLLLDDHAEKRKVDSESVFEGAWKKSKLYFTGKKSACRVLNILKRFFVKFWEIICKLKIKKLMVIKLVIFLIFHCTPLIYLMSYGKILRDRGEWRSFCILKNILFAENIACG